MADSGVHRQLAAIIKQQFPNARITSAYRPGSTGSGGRPDYHSTGNAIDIAPPSMAIFNWIAQNYPNSTELIYTPAGSRQLKNGKPHTYSAAVAVGHFNHIHWAMAENTNAIPASSGSGGGDGLLASLNPLQPLFDLVGFLTDKGTWVRIGLGVLGVLLIGIAFLALTRGTIDLSGVVKRGR